jgi:LysM repeat protein
MLAAVGGTLVVALGLAGMSGAFSGAPAVTPSPTPDATSSTPPPTAPPSLVEASASVAPTAAASNPVTPTPAATPRTYVVQSGDTLNEIALRFGTTAAAIRSAKGLTSDTINVGQELIIP